MVTGSIVIARFPFAYSKGYKWRPALVVGHIQPHEDNDLYWLAMITTDKPEWAGDIVIAASAKTGLHEPCTLRCAKITTVARSATRVIGKAPPEVISKARKFIAKQVSPK